MNRIYRGAIWGLLVVWLVAFNTSCTRRFYRKQADCEVDAVLREKDIFHEWKIENMQFYPDPRARFADPTNPDRPPMPPDDPAARYLGPNPQKPRHAGIDRVQGHGFLDILQEWDVHNRAERAMLAGNDNPDMLRLMANWQDGQKPELLPLPKPVDRAVDGAAKTERSPYLIKIDQAMELGLINSREFQTRREDLYLTALPVTRERYAFSTQFFAIEQIIREHTGAALPPGHGDRWQYSSTVGLSKLFSTGALLLVGFANRTVIELSNPALRHTTSVSNIDLDFIQPLLRGGGRAVTLEPLTQVERNLLYEIRDYARFRRQYYQYLIGGGAVLPSLGVTSAGNLSALHPLPSSLAAGNPARQQVSPSAAGSLNLSIFGVAPNEGFLPSIFKVATLQNEVANVQRLNEVLKLFEAYESGGVVSSLQVGQVQLQLLQSESLVLARQQEVRDSLDNFKQQLGVPVNLPIELDDAQLRPITDQFARYDAIIKEYGDAVLGLDLLDQPDKAATIREPLIKLVTESRLAKGTTEFRERVPKRWEHWRTQFKDNKALLDQLEKEAAIRRKLYDRKAELEKVDQLLSAAELEQLRTAELEIAIGTLEMVVRRYESMPWAKLPTERAKRDEQAARWRDLRIAVVLILDEASNERFRHLRTRWAAPSSVVVGGVDLIRTELPEAYDVVERAALDNRLDLMNTRAQTVDAWRQLRVFANNLLGTFTVAYHMDSSTPPDAAKPLAFQASRTRHQLGMNLELPLVRLTERNAYRASLIAYQRARRNLDQHEDEIVNAVRSEVRALQVLAKNLTIQQKAVELAYQQVESSLETFRAPEAPGVGGDPATRAAALTQQLLNAYRGLPQAQNALLRTWIDYQIVRQQLYLDLELMPLDARGVWIDELANQPSGGQHFGRVGNERHADDADVILPAARFGRPTP